MFKIISILLLIFLSNCSSNKKDVYVERTIYELYSNGKKELIEKNYSEAASSFDEVERQHPYSVWAIRAQLMSAYSHYLNQKYDQAINSLNSFLQLHPGHKDVPYALYLKGLCYYERIVIVKRDQNITKKTMDIFKELVTKFPSSKYSKAVKPKIDLTIDHLAGKEMYIGRFYLRKQAYLSAINRFKHVIDKYQMTTHVPEALHRLVEAYIALRLNDEAKKTASILGHNFPGSFWYESSYNLIKEASTILK